MVSSSKAFNDIRLCYRIYDSFLVQNKEDIIKKPHFSALTLLLSFFQSKPSSCFHHIYKIQPLKRQQSHASPYSSFDYHNVFRNIKPLCKHPSMTTKRSQREQSPNSYKYIHSKNIYLGSKHSYEETSVKNIEYFPIRPVKRQISNNLDSSKTNTTNREASETSRYSKRESLTQSQYQQEHRLVQKENERLKKEMTRLEKLMLEKDDRMGSLKQLELELVQTYRVIHYYQGKIKELEKICKQYEKEFQSLDIKKNKTSKTAGMLEELRNGNAQLRGQMQQKNAELNKVTAQLRKTQVKYYSNQQKLQALREKVSDNRFIASKQQKFIDDYQQNNLMIGSSTPKNTFTKRRPEISRGKLLLKNSNQGQSQSQGSVASSQYKNSVYIKRKGQKTLRPSEDSLRNSKHKSVAYGNISSKLNNIESELESLRKENERLQQELDCKTRQIMKVKEENIELEKKSMLPQSIDDAPQIELRKVTISKDKLKVIQNPNNLQARHASTPKNDNKLSMFVSNISSKGPTPSPINSQQQPVSLDKRPQRAKSNKKSGYSFSQIHENTVKKVILRIAREDITYFNLIDSIVEAWTSQDPNSLRQLLQQSSFNLSPKQTQQFVREYKMITKHLSSKERQSAHKDMTEPQYKKYIAQEIKSILKDNIPYFKNITIRRDFTLNIQLSNKFKNYEQQLQEVIKRYGNSLPIREWESNLMSKWNFTSQESLFLQIKNFEQHQTVQTIHIAQLGKYFLLE